MKKMLIWIFGCIFIIIVLSGCNESVTEKDRHNIPIDQAKHKYADYIKNKTFILIPEKRELPIKWFDSIPENSLIRTIKEKEFSLNSNPGEYFVFQIGVWSLTSIDDINIVSSDFSRSNEPVLPSSLMTCFNKEGIDQTGKHFTKKVALMKDRIQTLWFGLDLSDAQPGIYRGTLTISANGWKQIVLIKLRVKGETVINHGYNQDCRLSRLNWLNSSAGIDDSVTKGYQPVTSDGPIIKILGRDMNIGSDGLPAQIKTYFTDSNQSISNEGEFITSKHFRFIIQKSDGKTINLLPERLEFIESNPVIKKWTVLNRSDAIDLEVTGQMEFDGFIDYKLKLIAKKPLNLRDIRLEIPIVRDKAEYMMGLNHEGGLRKPGWKWEWDTRKNQDVVWVGSVNGGLRIKFKDENYRRPLVNIYYSFCPINLPVSWGNDLKGGINVTDYDEEVVINSYSGNRELKQNDTLNFNFELLITPFKQIDKNSKYNDRYLHGGGVIASEKPQRAQSEGANIINIHHAEDIYPFINYPFLESNVEQLKSLVKDCHDRKIRLKLYYTTRELTKNLPEFWPFYSLNGEIIFPGPGNDSRTEALHRDGPNEWLRKNLKEKYIPAWYNEIKEGKFKGDLDLSVITTPDSRLNNFYIGGLSWMVDNLGIDGVYIDDAALDRTTLMRARKVIDNSRTQGRIDLHSWNHFNKDAGWTNCLNLYMDLLPYIDLVWIGEGRDYNRSPDHWLIEISGIPFGLNGQMLQDGGNQWRGMVYGITNRLGWTEVSPVHIWKFFDDYELSGKKFHGYWEKDCPVKSNNKNCLASLYQGDHEVIISVANWTNKAQVTKLSVNWKQLGLNPDSAEVFIPKVTDFQEFQSGISLNRILIQGTKGYLIVIKKKASDKQ